MHAKNKFGMTKSGKKLEIISSFITHNSFRGFGNNRGRRAGGFNGDSCTKPVCGTGPGGRAGSLALAAPPEPPRARPSPQPKRTVRS